MGKRILARAALGAILFTIIMLQTTSTVYASNCSSQDDCFFTIDAGVIVVVGLLVLLAAVLIVAPILLEAAAVAEVADVGVEAEAAVAVESAAAEVAAEVGTEGAIEAEAEAEAAAEAEGAEEGLGSSGSNASPSPEGPAPEPPELVPETDLPDPGQLQNDGLIELNRSGTNRPLTGNPNSYLQTEGGHAVVYDGEGRLVADVSPGRIKTFTWNQAPNGQVFPRVSGKISPVPPEWLKLLK